MTAPHARPIVTATGTSDSPDYGGSPGVLEVPGYEELFVIGRQVHDPQVHAAVADHLGHDDAGLPELLSAVQRWVPTTLMDLPTFQRYMKVNLHRAGDSVFRMECLPRYEVTSDGDDYHRWLAGATEPTWSRKQPWLDILARDTAAGITHSRVRMFGHELTEYELYACNFGYALNAEAGEDIRVLRDGEHDIPDLAESEYWIFNDDIVVPVMYDRRGRFIGAGVLPAERGADFLADRDAAWHAAEPFQEWWARHGELHRARAAA